MGFFGAKKALFTHKMASNGPILGPWSVNFAFLRVPDPPGTFRE